MNSGKVFLLAGLGFGDEGKGTITEALTRQFKAGLVVRYNGGAQASHHVVRDDGTVHAFRQFGSGTFEGARTHLSRFHLFDPEVFAWEATALKSKGISDPWKLLTVDEDSPLVTIYHVMANQIQECARSPASRHGSCGMGIWETQSLSRLYGDMVPRAKDLHNLQRLQEKLAFVRQLFLDACEHLRDINDDTRKKWDHLGTSPNEHAADLREVLPLVVGREHLSTLMRDAVTVFEGAQGVLLDQDYGFSPHVTGTTTLFDNATTLLDEIDFLGEVQTIGVMRTYMTRHGAGPMPTEHAADQRVFDAHNGYGKFQGGFRSGVLDLVLLRYALRCLRGVDMLAITHADREIEFLCDNYYDHGEIHPAKDKPIAMQEALTRAMFSAQPLIEPADGRGLDYIASRLERTIGIVSRGPKAKDKTFTI